MQMQEAIELRKMWGNKPCKHPKLDKEYFNGTDTGDLVCTTCGEARPAGEWGSNGETCG